MPTPVEELSPVQLQWVLKNQLARGASATGDGAAVDTYEYRQYLESAVIHACCGSAEYSGVSSYRKRKRSLDEPVSSTELLSSQEGQGANTQFPHLQRNLSWDQHFENLIAFKKKHGHCHVPKSYDDKPDLASWAHQQRIRKKTSGSLSPEQVELLEKASFSFDDKSVVSVVSMASSLTL